MATLGERLKHLRERKELTQVRVAKHLGISNAQLSRYESDIHKPDPDTLEKLAKLYDTTTDYLISGEHKTRGSDPSISPEQLEFLKWVEENLEESFFYDFNKSPEEQKEDAMDILRIYWEKQKRRAEKREPSHKQGE